MKVVQVQIQFKSHMHDFQTPAASGEEKKSPGWLGARLKHFLEGSASCKL